MLADSSQAPIESTAVHTQPKSSMALYPSRSRRLSWAIPLLLASLCFWKAFSTESQAVAPAVVNQSASRLRITPIPEMRTGMRVIGDNPELAAEDIDPLQIEDPSQWRNVRLEMIKENGSLLKITLLRPLEWLDENEAMVGSLIELDLEELGAAGPAEVLAIEPCPEIERGNRPLVTGTFEHLAANVVDLQVESEAEPIGTTDNHPFWSEDRQQFVAAGELKIGEVLRLADGQTTRVTSIVPRAGPKTVYNLEISGQHVYHVGGSGVLVHNAYPTIKGHSYPDTNTSAFNYNRFRFKKAHRSEVANAVWSDHGGKHIRATTVDDAIKFSSGGGPAQYVPGIGNRHLERFAAQHGVVAPKPGTSTTKYFYYDFGYTIGYSNGKATSIMRAEITSGTLHGHPRLPDEIPSDVLSALANLGH
jgi:hypothetical protein